MKIKVAINGFGRIGRQVFKHIENNHADLEVVAINDLTDTKTLAHLLAHDSTYGNYGKDIGAKEKSIIVDGKEIPVLSEKEPEKLPWEELKVDIVLECTGFFTDQAGAGKHITAGAKKVIVSAPCKDLPGYVLGVNEETYDSAKVHVMDMGSCTTNCIAPIAKVLNDELGIVKGFMTTIHSYTGDQNLVDGSHKDLRRARAAALSMIPSTTGAAKTIGLILPELKGRLDGTAIRVPTANVSLVDLTFTATRNTTKQEINEALTKAANGELKGILGVSSEPLVSTDYNHSSESSNADLTGTFVTGGNLVRVASWYDNEWGFSCRMLDVAKLWAGL